MRDALGATSQEICDTSRNNNGSCFARFGKHSMLLALEGLEELGPILNRGSGTSAGSPSGSQTGSQSRSFVHFSTPPFSELRVGMAVWTIVFLPFLPAEKSLLSPHIPTRPVRHER